MLGQGLKDLQVPRDELVIATKVLGKMKENRNRSGLSRYHIFNAVNDSLERLQLDHIDTLYIHGVDFKTSLEDVVRSLNDVVESGKVLYIAICNWPAWMVAKAQAIAHFNGWLAWVRQQPGVTSTIIGAKNIEQLQSNVGSTDLYLSEADLLKIEEVSPLPKQYPGWMIEN